jgi:hypothetical protein
MKEIYEDEHTYVWTPEERDSPAVLAIKRRLKWSYEHNHAGYGFPWNEGARALIDVMDDVRKAESKARTSQN